MNILIVEDGMIIAGNLEAMIEELGHSLSGLRLIMKSPAILQSSPWIYASSILSCATARPDHKWEDASRLTGIAVRLLTGYPAELQLFPEI